ncbi:OLC1v1035765C2 [Oldenlandia corymbosa var. corymbosa]|uniref:OLC1v1035765C2 n=1 Tax=Oldenlandia corymbosa var. corymbosa TaxID=529605 RepID=A0AAV1CUG2_OLDCO|nr:OLC1v1035765C2 [Oldenlandia corymbosa var. corymbosa]
MGSEFRGRRGKGTGRVSVHQVAFELKQRVVLALNKIADRDTYQIGVEELEKTIECLTPDGLASFFSCILDTDSVQKSAVRKECIRSMGSLATYHKGLVLPYLGKMVASIVKRLKDSDTVVRDTCVDTMGVLASKLGGDGVDNDGFFVALVKPLFEALGEQNKYVQSGSALCLARVIDNINDPPVSILQKMLARTVKLLKNPHFMAKPAVIELNRSIIQAGGAATRTTLSAAICSIQEALKNSDWLTRKAASAALGEIASTGGTLLSTFRTSSLRCLESCRFDKVKPVRETALQALQIWRDLPGSDTPEPSEAGSSVKENFFRDEYHEVTSACDSTPAHVSTKKTGNTVTKRFPLSNKRSGQSPVGKAHYSKADDWHVEIAVPKTSSMPDTVDEESQGSCITKTCERTSVDLRSTQDIEYEYVHVEDKQRSSASLFSENFECKALMVCSDVLGEVDRAKKPGWGVTYPAEEISTEEKRFTAKNQDRCSLDSTVIESCSPKLHCCSQTANEMASIQKHLLDIENKQTTLMDLFKIFTANIIESMSMIQKKVSSLEDVISGVAQELVKEERYAPATEAKLLKRNQDSCSPRISTCTPRPPVDTHTRPSTLPKTADVWEENISSRSSSSSFRQETDIWSKTCLTLTKSTSGKGNRENVRYGTLTGKHSNVFPPVSGVRNRQSSLERNDDIWREVRGYLSHGDLDSAYAQALYYSNELVLFELMGSTGPVLEHLSEKTTGSLLNTLASYLSKQKFATSIFPWLQQVVDLTVAHGPDYVVVLPKQRRAFLSAVEQFACLKFSNPVERRFAAELAAALHQIWGKCS